MANPLFDNSARTLLRLITFGLANGMLHDEDPQVRRWVGELEQHNNG